MADLPAGTVFIDLLVPPGTSQRIQDLQTRLDLVGGGEWRVIADDGTMESSSLPLQPVRGTDERLWVCRTHPFTPTDNLQSAASMALELSGMCNARMAAVGVAGMYAWGFVLVDDFHSLYGLLLLDWLYNPRVSSKGEVVEDPEPSEVEAEMQAKTAMFSQLWTTQGSQLLMSQLPPGVLQQVEGYQALSLLGPSGQFDPRLWQGLAMQLVLPMLQVTAAGGLPPAAPGSPSAPSPAAPAGVATEPSQAAVPEPPSDGLTPLARAQLEAGERLVAGESAEAPAEAPEATPIDGESLHWRDGEQGFVLWMPKERFDADLLRALQGGDFGRLQRAERPPSEQQERWIAGGGVFVTELPSFSRLFVDGVPLYRAAFEAASAEENGLAVLSCHLPRVCRVRAVVVADDGPSGRRILVSSNPELAATEVVRLAGP
jgi:hypothetical protein